MHALTYTEFLELIERYKIFPFSSFIPEYPSLTAVAPDNDWHTGTETDPWQWRVQVVEGAVAAYGKFFGDKACFIQVDFFPSIRSILTSDKTVEERYHDGLLSKNAYNIYNVLYEHGIVDSRALRKLTGLHAKENKKEYEKSLVELQNYGDVVITGAAKQNDNDSGWSSMCYQSAELWLSSIQESQTSLSIEDAKKQLIAALLKNSSSKSLQFFAKKLKLAELANA